MLSYSQIGYNYINPTADMSPLMRATAIFIAYILEQ